MYQPIQIKTTVPHSISRLPLRRGLLLIPVILACFAFSPAVRGVTPQPDGTYVSFNVAEGFNALLSLTTGTSNTAIGFAALASNTTGNHNTAFGLNTMLFNTTALLAPQWQSSVRGRYRVLLEMFVETLSAAVPGLPQRDAVSFVLPALERLLSGPVFWAEPSPTPPTRAARTSRTASRQHSARARSCDGAPTQSPTASAPRARHAPARRVRHP